MLLLLADSQCGKRHRSVHGAESMISRACAASRAVRVPNTHCCSPSHVGSARARPWRQLRHRLRIKPGSRRSPTEVGPNGSNEASGATEQEHSRSSLTQPVAQIQVACAKHMVRACLRGGHKACPPLRVCDIANPMSAAQGCPNVWARYSSLGV